MAAEVDEVNAASGRRWLYGLNVALLVTISAVILGFFFGLTNKYTKHWDMTSAGLYSLSSSTKSLLKRVDESKRDYTLLNLFDTGAPGTERERIRQQVSDGLAEYARSSGYIKVETATGMTEPELQKRIRELYATEVKPYEDTIGEFEKLSQESEKFLKDEGATIGAAAQKPGTPRAAQNQAAQLQGELVSKLPEYMARVRPAVRKAMESPLPKWAGIADVVKTMLDEFTAQLDPLTDANTLKGKVEPALQDYFTSAAPRFKEQVGKLKAYRERLEKLQPLKVDTVLNALGPNTVLLLGPASAKVITQDEMFTPGPTPPGGQTPTPLFNGEQAISSALLGMIQPEKMKVVFVSASAMQLTTQVYSRAADMLRESNFDVLEWSPPAPPMGPDQPPQGDPNPPATGKGVVWVIFPPAAATQQMMMMGMMPPNPQPVIDAAKRHMAAGGQALFLADASGGGFMPGGSGYAYAELLKDFGVEVQSKYTVVRQIERQDPDSGDTIRRVMPVVQIDQFSQHEITRPLASLPTILAPLQGRAGYTGMPTVVSVRSVGTAEATVLFWSPKSADYWGESELKPDAAFDKTQDFAAPVPLAAAAVRFKGQKDKEQRVVVLGSSTVASTSLLDESQLVRVGNQIRPEATFPGNAELFRNSVLWLAGYENMIAVSSKASVAVRISDISPASLAAIRWGILFVGAPVLALVIGGFVWFWRRR